MTNAATGAHTVHCVTGCVGCLADGVPSMPSQVMACDLLLWVCEYAVRITQLNCISSCSHICALH